MVRLLKWGFVSSLLLLLSSMTVFAQENEQLLNGNFDAGFTSWWASPTGTFADGQYCVQMGTNPSANDWDEMFGQNRIKLIEGETYRLSFDAIATVEDISFFAFLQNGSTNAQRGRLDVTTTTEWQTFTKEFVMAQPTDELVQLTMQMGGSPIQGEVCLDNFSLVGGEPRKAYVADTGSAVRVNQHGYTIGWSKEATYVASKTADAVPMPWSLLNMDGTTVLTGTTTYLGYDKASGDIAHAIDFTAFNEAGTGYTLQVGTEVSYPFEIGKGLYDQLTIDSLHYFYHNRSNIDIEAQYVGEEYARLAGHTADTISRDDAVTCGGWTTDLSGAYGCPYQLDVRGGWYDAGDHGKYVVNGGISVWKILNSYERAIHVKNGMSAIHKDGTVPIPENGDAISNGTLVSFRGNGVPDSLDEVRWELEFLMKMQVPKGKYLAGMAHHKMHNMVWTGIPTLPVNDTAERILRPPSTAATLNLAATAAQCSRIWKTIDPDFAGQCLESAETAWLAALANPDMYIYENDNNRAGGGPYSDDIVSDEFYWAAAELFITTGKQEYLNYLQASEHHDGNAIDNEFFWQATAPLGSISLATVPNQLPDAEQAQIEQAIVDASDFFIARKDGQAYPTSYKTDAYDWGSNNIVMNNAIVMGTAYDLTQQNKYLTGVLNSMDYLLGQNVLNISYISQYGDNAFKNPHHRHWAKQASSDYPNPPPGSVSGGPNSNLQDPAAQVALVDCVSTPQRCYIDDIESYATNEVTVNWNSALVWTSSFLSSQGDVDPTAVTLTAQTTASNSIYILPLIGLLGCATRYAVRNKQ